MTLDDIELVKISQAVLAAALIVHFCLLRPWSARADLLLTVEMIDEDLTADIDRGSLSADHPVVADLVRRLSLSRKRVGDGESLTSVLTSTPDRPEPGVDELIGLTPAQQHLLLEYTAELSTATSAYLRTVRPFARPRPALMAAPPAPGATTSPVAAVVFEEPAVAAETAPPAEAGPAPVTSSTPTDSTATPNSTPTDSTPPDWTADSTPGTFMAAVVPPPTLFEPPPAREVGAHEPISTTAPTGPEFERPQPEPTVSVVSASQAPSTPTPAPVMDRFPRAGSSWNDLAASAESAWLDLTEPGAGPARPGTPAAPGPGSTGSTSERPPDDDADWLDVSPRVPAHDWLPQPEPPATAHRGPARPPVVPPVHRIPTNRIPTNRIPTTPPRDGVRHGRVPRGGWRTGAQHARDLAAAPEQPRILDLSAELPHDSLYNPRPYDRLPLDRASLDRLAHNRLMYDNGAYDDLSFPDPQPSGPVPAVEPAPEPVTTGSGMMFGRARRALRRR